MTSWLNTRVSMFNWQQNNPIEASCDPQNCHSCWTVHSVTWFSDLYCFLLYVSELFKVRTDLHLPNHLPPAFPWGILSLQLLGPVLYCPQPSSLRKVSDRSFEVTFQVSDTFLQLVVQIKTNESMHMHHFINIHLYLNLSRTTWNKDIILLLLSFKTRIQYARNV